ncbi:MAG: rhodanese-like domain-containing protein [Bacteroidota bacterium]|nr:rhodanese-like domain-containing protein [Bacteroidota bacterium]
MFGKLSLNKKLAAIAIVLGLIGILAGSPQESSAGRVDTNQLAIDFAKQSNIVKPTDIAKNIIEGSNTFRMIDLRNESEFTSGNIEGSDNIPVAQINKSDLKRNEKILLYSNSELETAQAWMLLKSKNYKSVYMLKGGWSGWQKEVLGITEGQTEASGSMFGNKTTDETAIATTPSASIKPPPAMPAKSGKKKKEGC